MSLYLSDANGLDRIRSQHQVLDHTRLGEPCVVVDHVFEIVS